MNTKEAVAAAKAHLNDLLADEGIRSVELEEFEHIAAVGQWTITLSFARPWATPRTRAQEVLENLGAAPAGRKAYKVLTLADDGTVLSMKDRVRADARAEAAE